jgi:multimeric flavodoxin WrbA
MKKIIIINSSHRKKATYGLLNKLAALLGEFSIEFINLNDYRIKPCIGCENCLRNGACFIDDDAASVLKKLSEADGIIIGSPVYLRQISGYLKLLIDRGCAFYHRSPLVGKPIFFVTTTQASGSKQAVKYLKDLSLQWGTILTGTVSRTMFNIQKPIAKNTLKKFIYYLEPQNTKKYKPTMKQIIEFNTQKVLACHVLPLDYSYWSEKGYLDKAYFFDSIINPFKRLVGYCYFKMLSYFIVKGKNKS